MTAASTLDNRDTPQGFALAITAYVMWGVFPLYLKLLSEIPPTEVLAHRIIWSVPFAGVVLLVLRRTRDVRAALRNPRMLAMGCVTALLVSLNWGIYVWAIANDQAVEAALGYYINPLFSVFLGAVLLGERLTRLQLAAILLAVTAVVVLTLDQGRLPFVALSLTFTWGFYAFFKKSLPIGPNQGFFLEVLTLLPFAAGYVVYLSSVGRSHFGQDPDLTLLFLGCGVVTSVPLMIYANAAKRVRLSTIGVLQYIAPTMIFLFAVLVFGEPFGGAQLIAFPMIWAALVLYSIPLIRSMRG